MGEKTTKPAGDGRSATDSQPLVDLLLKSGHIFRWLCDSAPIGLFVTDENGDCTYANRRLLTICGLSLDECLGRRWLQLVHPADRRKVDRIISETLLAGREFVSQFRIITAKGEVRSISVATTWFRSDEGQLIGQVGAVEDITDRLAAEDALRESQERYRTLVENIDAGITLIDREYNVLMTNAWQGRAFCKQVAEFVGKKCFQEFEKRTEVCEHCPGRIAMSTGRAAEAETEGVRDDGSKFPVRIRAFPLANSAGEPRGFIELIEDISQRRRAEDEVKRLQQQVEFILGASNTGLDIIDARFNLRFVDSQWVRKYGDYRGKKCYDYFMGRQSACPSCAIPGVLERKQPSVSEAILVKEGNRHVQVTTIPFQNENGEWLVAEVNVDISERKQAEEEVRKFKTITDQAPHGVAIVDLDGMILYLNEAFARMHGYAPAELIGRNLSVFHTEEQMPLVNRLNERLRTEGKFSGEEVWHCRRDGTVFPTIMDSVLIRDEDGKAVFMSGMAVDISDRKRVEAEIRRQALVFENINDGIIITDREGKITDWNPGAERIFDYFKHEIVGQSPEILDRPEEAKLLTKCIRDGLEHDGYWAGEVDFIRKDGSEGICEAFLVPLHDEGGEWIGTVSVNRDITARKRDEQEKARLEAELMQAQKMEAVGTLASGIAHDFNNLLTVIFGCTDHAKSMLPPDHPATTSVQMIEQAGNHAQGVINALLTFTLRGTTEKLPVNLVTSLTQALQLLRRLLPASVEIDEDLPTGEEHWVKADAAQLQQIWMNLAINARDAMPRGGRLRVSLRADPARCTPGEATAETPPVAVVVEDSGIGMTETVKARMFEPFFTTKPPGQGSGLGMSLIHAIIADHGGQIQVDSAPGKGTRTIIRLPCCARPAPGSAAIESSSRRPGHGEVVSVVEQDSHVRSILVSVLRSAGYTVVAPDTDNGRQLEAKQHVDLIVLDADVPEGDGPSRFGRIREMFADVPVLVIAGQPIDPALEKRLDGRYCLLVKPFYLLELIRQVSHILADAGGKKAAQE